MSEEGSRDVAKSLVYQHLNGRYLPRVAEDLVVRIADARLIKGQEPALNSTLQAFIDRHAIAWAQAFPQISAPAEDPISAFK